MKDLAPDAPLTGLFADDTEMLAIPRIGDAAVLVTDSHRTDPAAARGRGYGWQYGDIDASLGARIP